MFSGVRNRVVQTVNPAVRMVNGTPLSAYVGGFSVAPMSA
jgi:hypothetical protein